VYLFRELVLFLKIIQWILLRGVIRNVLLYTLMFACWYITETFVNIALVVDCGWMVQWLASYLMM